MTEPLRELLAQFTVEVDPDGALDKGNAAVDALKSKLAGLERELARIRAPAAAAGQALARAFSAPATRAAVGGLALGAGGGGGGAGGGPPLLGSGGGGGGGLAIGGGGPLARAGGGMPLLGSGVDPLSTWREQLGAANGFAGALRAKLAPALEHIKRGFAGPSGTPSEGGPGLLDRLLTFKNGVLAFAGGQVVGGIRSLVGHVGDIADNAARLGVTNAEVQRLGVLAKLSGTNVGTLGTAFRTLATNATSGSEESAEAFGKLGIETRKADGSFKSRQELFFETAGALADVGDETERAALAQKLFGRSAIELAPLLAKGSAAVAAQREELEKLPVLSDRTIAAADDLGDQWAMLGPKILKAAEPLIELLIPALETLTEWSVKALDSIGKWLKQTDFLAVGLTALAGVLALKVIPGLRLMIGLGGGASRTFLTMAGSLGKFALNLVKTLGPLLILEDFIVFLRGGKSVIGTLLDQAFGEGTAKGTLKALSDMTAAFKDLWKWILGDGQGEKVKALYNEIAEGIGLIFHDMLVKLGLRNAETGLQGKADYEAGKAGTGPGKALKTLGAVDQSDPFIQSLNAIAARRRGEQIPAPGGAQPGGQGTTTVISADGDRNVTVILPPGSSARDVAPAVSNVLERDRNATQAGVPGG